MGNNWERETKRSICRQIHGTYHREAVAIPAKPSVNMKTTLMSKSGHDVFDGPCKNVAIVGEPRGKRGAVVEVKPTTQNIPH